MNNIYEKVKVLLLKYMNRETITYIIAGVLTTVVNLISYYILTNLLNIDYLIANVIAWVIAVTFAYVVNDKWVFQSEKGGLKTEFEKVIKFFSSRVFTLIVEEAGMYVFVDLLHLNDFIIKVILAIVVIILNYIFSKLFIFKASTK